MTRGITLGETVFTTKQAALDHARKMLWAAQIGARVPEPAATDLLHLFQRHPEVEIKQGTGIAYFSAKETLHGARVFEVVRRDGSRDHFSIYACLQPPPSMSRKISDALRFEVEADILQKKEVYFQEHGDGLGRVHCALTGEMIATSEAHADHAPPWTCANLVTAFVAARASDFEHSSSLLTMLPDDPYRPRLADRELAKAWREFHHTLANIRIVSKAAHSERSGAKDIRGAYGLLGREMAKEQRNGFQPNTCSIFYSRLTLPPLLLHKTRGLPIVCAAYNGLVRFQ